MFRFVFIFFCCLLSIFNTLAQEIKITPIQEVFVLSNRLEANQFESGKDITIKDLALLIISILL